MKQHEIVIKPYQKKITYKEKRSTLPNREKNWTVKFRFI